MAVVGRYIKDINIFTMKYLIITFLLLTTLAAHADEKAVRYRGQYTFGHEVNSFCPEINSQCYWLAPESNPQARQQLIQLTANNTSNAYQAICVVVEGKINRDPDAKSSIGFAADYDGLFTVNKVFDLCSKTSIVTQGDLQHHRWILKSINHNRIDTAKLNNKIPELDFGEQMTVSGNTGCNNFSAKAILHDEIFSLIAMISTRMFCAPEQNNLESLLNRILIQESKITVNKDKKLILESHDTRLEFHIKDWVQ